MKIDNFFSELKRRNILRMAGLYLRFQAQFKSPATGGKDGAHE
jgi:hypothetical protein